ncbi:MAG: lipase [Burkholderiales bacterium]|nr:lipase [Burkholderiales bacterium]
MRRGDHRICFVGDSFVQGTGDTAGGGWVGRIAAAACAAGYDITAYNLGVRRDTSADIAARWQAECDARLRTECSPYLLFSFGANDMTADGQTLRVPMPASIENFRSIVGEARERCPTLVTGPLPVGDSAQDTRIIALCATYALLAAELGVPYLPLAEHLTNDSAWKRAAAAGDGTHPDGSGYALVAERVLQWPAWWFRPD